MVYPPPSRLRLRPPVITLLTDFGLTDAYVAIMKGVITGIHPGVGIIDLTHQIPPQNIRIGSFQLGNAYPHFPPDTIHVGVVDPGVGGDRRAVAIQTNSGIVVGPDNGLFSHVLMQEEVDLAVELTNNEYWYLKEPSNTFHGRDIFAPVAAYLAKGIPLHALGTIISSASLTTLPEIDTWQPIENGGTGKIQAIDYFGNLITNIPATIVQNRSWNLEVGPHLVSSTTSYTTTEVHPRLQALVGSHGWLEIALPFGSAQQVLHVNVGERVQLHLYC